MVRVGPTRAVPRTSSTVGLPFRPRLTSTRARPRNGRMSSKTAVTSWRGDRARIRMTVPRGSRPLMTAWSWGRSGRPRVCARPGAVAARRWLLDEADRELSRLTQPSPLERAPHRATVAPERCDAVTEPAVAGQRLLVARSCGARRTGFAVDATPWREEVGAVRVGRRGGWARWRDRIPWDGRIRAERLAPPPGPVSPAS
jgi:hypothetical protein